MMIRLAALIGVLGAGAPCVPVPACGLEGGPGSSFGAAYPGSLDVAFAAHDAINAGALLPDSVLEPELAHDRADDRLQSLAAALPLRGAAASFAVLLVETGTWTRLTPKGGHWFVSDHVDGPRPREPTLIASELALRDLAEGRLTVDRAMELGLLSVQGGDPLAAALNHAYSVRLP